VAKGHFCFALLLLSLLIANAQDPTPPRSTEVRDRKIFEEYERHLAQIFEMIRRENKLPKLSRISRRQELDQIACTAALNDANPYGHNSPAALVYATSDPTSVTEELESIARFNQVETPPNSRYAVAIWPGTDKENGQRIYWVGIKIYMSAFYEFIDNTFTDNRPYRNQWKEMVAPACRGVR
jgi:hypothetical protein